MRFYLNTLLCSVLDLGEACYTEEAVKSPSVAAVAATVFVLLCAVGKFIILVKVKFYVSRETILQVQVDDIDIQTAVHEP